MTVSAAVVVTYFPDPSDIRYWAGIAGFDIRVFMVDNTPGPISLPAETPDFHVIKNRENIGLAAACNEGVRRAVRSGAENLFLFDQDSRPGARFFSDMLEFQNTASRGPRPLGFCVPDFFDRNSKSRARFPLLTRYTLGHGTCRDPDFHERTRGRTLIAITSGMLIRASAWEAIGPFRPDYFIDFIDNEYCLRAYRTGYVVRVNCAVTLDHSIGRRTVHRWAGLTFKPNHHSPVRRYYIARNGLCTALDFFRDYPAYFPLLMARMVHECLSVILFEPEKGKKVRKMALGFWHGLRRKTGPFRNSPRP